jgi:hypothetical protein
VTWGDEEPKIIKTEDITAKPETAKTETELDPVYGGALPDDYVLDYSGNEQVKKIIGERTTPLTVGEVRKMIRDNTALSATWKQKETAGTKKEKKEAEKQRIAADNALTILGNFLADLLKIIESARLSKGNEDEDEERGLLADDTVLEYADNADVKAIFGSRTEPLTVKEVRALLKQSEEGAADWSRNTDPNVGDETSRYEARKQFNAWNDQVTVLQAFLDDNGDSPEEDPEEVPAGAQTA